MRVAFGRLGASPLGAVTAIEAIVRQDDRRPSNGATGGGRPLLLLDACWGHDELVAAFTREQAPSPRAVRALNSTSDAYVAGRLTQTTRSFPVSSAPEAGIAPSSVPAFLAEQ